MDQLAFLQRRIRDCSFVDGIVLFSDKGPGPSVFLFSFCRSSLFFLFSKKMPQSLSEKKKKPLELFPDISITGFLFRIPKKVIYNTISFGIMLLKK